jgi:hypothetical protein
VFDCGIFIEDKGVVGFVCDFRPAHGFVGVRKGVEICAETEFG